jgi:hypothetical protein
LSYSDVPFRGGRTIEKRGMKILSSSPCRAPLPLPW